MLTLQKIPLGKAPIREHFCEFLMFADEELSVTHGLYELSTPHLSCLSSPPPERKQNLSLSESHFATTKHVLHFLFIFTASTIYLQLF